MNCGRVPTRPGLVKSRIAQRSPRPFSIGVPVSATRVRAGMRRSCCDVSFAGFLIACASSSTTRAHSTSAIASTSRTAVPYVVTTTSASATSAAISSGAARLAPWCTTTRSSGVKRSASAIQLPTTAGGAITNAGPSSRARAGARASSASCRGPCRARGNRRGRPSRGSRATRAPRSDSCAARRRSRGGVPRGIGLDLCRPLRAGRTPNRRLRSRRRPASGESSRPSARRSISAPVSCLVLSRSASASAAALRSTWSIATQRPPVRMSGRASFARRAMSAAVSSTSSNTADQRTFGELVRTDGRSPTRVDVDAQRRRARALARTSGTRTSKPAATRRGPVVAIRSHASSALRIDLAAPHAARPQQHRQHALEARHLVFEVLAVGRRP